MPKLVRKYFKEELARRGNKIYDEKSDAAK